MGSSAVRAARGRRQRAIALPALLGRLTGTIPRWLQTRRRTGSATSFETPDSTTIRDCSCPGPLTWRAVSSLAPIERPPRPKRHQPDCSHSQRQRALPAAAVVYRRQGT